MSKYSELFKDPRWQKKRLEVLQRDGWKCKMCGDAKSSLNVHHKWYVKDRSPWEYKDNALVTLCENCHYSEHEIKETAISLISIVLLSKGLFFDDFVDIAGKIKEMSDSDLSDLFGILNRTSGGS